MDIKELMYIKSAQREFQEKFGKRLVVDFSAMQGITSPLEMTPEEYKIFYNSFQRVPLTEEFVLLLMDKHNLTKEHFKDKTTYNKDNFTAFMIEYSNMVKVNRWRQETAASYINRDRTVFSFYRNYEAVRTNKKVVKFKRTYELIES